MPSKTEKKLKIAYLSHSPLLTHVANAVHVMHMCSAFARNGHDVSLYARGRRYPQTDLFRSYGIESGGFEIVLLPKGPLKVVGRLAYAIAQVLRARLVDAPDLYYARCPASAAFALLFGDVVLEVHELPRKRLEKRIQRHVLRHPRLRRVVTISRALLEDLAREHPGVLDGLDRVVAPDGAATPAARPAFALERGPGRQIGYAGGLRRGNGIGTIIALAEALPGDTFHVVGGGPGDVEFWRARQRSPNIVWYGQRDPAQVPAFLAACDVLLAPYENGAKTSSGKDTSRWMSPLKIFEYMAAGRAMIVSDYPVLREVLREDFAMLAAPARIDAWLASLRRLEDPAVRARLGARAVAVLEERYTWAARAVNVIAGLERRAAARTATAGEMPDGAAPDSDQAVVPAGSDATPERAWRATCSTASAERGAVIAALGNVEE